jgi:hypothetical protein
VVLISDHGFHSDHLRPKFTPQVPAGITVWHRPQGVFAASGTAFAKDALIHGARLLDVTPAILHYFGLSVGEDMEGRVLAEAFEEKRPVEFVPTWENPDGTRQKRSSLSKADSKALLDQFVALGYIDEVSENPDEAAAETNRENKWNLARAYLYAGKDEDALPLLENCFAAYPERSDSSLRPPITSNATGSCVSKRNRMTPPASPDSATGSPSAPPPVMPCASAAVRKPPANKRTNTPRNHWTSFSSPACRVPAPHS